MEVHQHTHTPRKKWTHYFWEFLMLFLAVTLGFFVENQREHFIENKREKQYIRSLVTDLKRDTANASLMLGRNILKFKGLDTLAELLQTENILDTTTITRLYNLSFEYTRTTSLVLTNEITIRQLLSSGNVRLLRKKGVYDSLVSYQLTKDRLSIQAEAYEEFYRKTSSQQEDIFKTRGYRKIILNNDTSFTRIFNNQKLELLSTDKLMLKKCGNAVEAWRGVISVYIFYLKSLKDKASNLLVFLNKEYHLD